MTQLTFPVKAQSQLEEKFLEFHAKHPEVYAALSLASPISGADIGHMLG